MINGREERGEREDEEEKRERESGGCSTVGAMCYIVGRARYRSQVPGPGSDATLAVDGSAAACRDLGSAIGSLAPTPSPFNTGDGALVDAAGQQKQQRVKRGPAAG